MFNTRSSEFQKLKMERRHRPGPLKQDNKPHKTGRHRSKGEIMRASKGKVSVIALSKKMKKQNSKEERRLQAAQARRLKREEYLNKRRGLSSVPILTVVVPLSDDVDCIELIRRLIGCHDDDVKAASCNERGVWHMSMTRFKQKFEFVLPSLSDRWSVLDSVKVADRVLMVASPNQHISDLAEIRLTEMFAQGMPSSILCSMGMRELNAKQKTAVHQMWNTDFISNRFPGSKVHMADTDSDRVLLLRALSQTRQCEVRFRDIRPYMLAEQLHFNAKADEETGTLVVSGFLRGKPLDVNSLVHVPGWGDFQMSHIEATPGPFDTTDKPTRELERCDIKLQTSLQAEPDVDMQDEQDLSNEPALQPDPVPESRRVPRGYSVPESRRVPRGYSQYQATWIEQDFSDNMSDSDNSIQENEDMCSESDASSDAGSDRASEQHSESASLNTISGGEELVDTKYDDNMDLEQDKNELITFRAARLNQLFPDERDTPHDIDARLRFQRYRGLQSFRTSPWDKNESLPPDYQKIFRFRDFNRIRRSVLKQDLEAGAQVGWFIRVHVINVPRQLYEKFRSTPLTLFGLLAHEHRMSVVNLVIRRQLYETESAPVVNKQPMLFQAGYRRFIAQPVFSTHSPGNKHKMERFLTDTDVCVASVYSTVQYPPSPVLAYTVENPDELCAVGSVLSSDPDRLIIKRIVLSGHPFKCNKKSAVIRYMFFNREDILWFKAIELRTKYGRRGHIKEPLGTHGHYKAVFDGQMKSQDTVLLNLYKRVFPKWSYDPNPDRIQIDD